MPVEPICFYLLGIPTRQTHERSATDVQQEPHQQGRSSIWPPTAGRRQQEELRLAAVALVIATRNTFSKHISRGC